MFLAPFCTTRIFISLWPCLIIIFWESHFRIIAFIGSLQPVETDLGCVFVWLDDSPEIVRVFHLLTGQVESAAGFPRAANRGNLSRKVCDWKRLITVIASTDYRSADRVKSSAVSHSRSPIFDRSGPDPTHLASDELMISAGEQ